MAVFIVTQNDGDSFDYGAAEKYGPITFIYDEAFRTCGKRGVAAMREHARSILDSVGRESDEPNYLILNPGPLLNNAIASAVFTYLNDGILTLLAFNPSLGEYTPLEVDIDDVEVGDGSTMEGQYPNG